MTSIRSDLEHIIGYTFCNKSVLQRALVHASAQKEKDNERLEFLGDRVAGLVIATVLFQMYPNEDEGCLARRHTALVQEKSMAEIARMIDLSTCLTLSAGESQAGGHDKDTILGDAMEALIGAVFIDGGYDAAESLIMRLWAPLLERQTAPPVDAKSALQEWAQARGLPLPDYIMRERGGPDHAPTFDIEVSVETLGTARGSGGSKRAAEKAAALALLEKIEGAEGLIS